jgi:hypothetical protein
MTDWLRILSNDDFDDGSVEPSGFSACELVSYSMSHAEDGVQMPRDL